MSGEGGRRAELVEAIETRDGATTLLVGSANHDTACRRLAEAARGRGYRVRLAPNEPNSVRAANTGAQYETCVYDDLALANAGIALAETVRTLDWGSGTIDPDSGTLDGDDGTLEPGQLVVCIDALPRPTSVDDRRHLFQFLHAVTHRVGTVEGHCHAHLAVDPDSRVAAAVDPLFEYVVDAADV